MKMIIMAVLMGLVSGAIVSFTTTVFTLRYWAVQEERRRKAARKARLSRMAEEETREERRRRDVFYTLQRSPEQPSESNITLFPTERARSGKGRIRGAYKGPDGAVTFVGMEGAGADV